LGTLYAWASPEVVSRMTMAQALLYLDSGEKKKGRTMSRAEIEAYCIKTQKEKGLI